MGKKTLHTALEREDVGRYVFLPGPPERTEKIAAYFDNPREIAYKREFRTFTGELDGEKVAVTSTGIGGSSAAIAIEELYQCGVDTMLRVGSCASVSSRVSFGDVVIPDGAVKMEGTSLHYLPVEYPAIPDFDMLRMIVEAAEKLGYPHCVGVTITKGAFHTQTEPGTKPVGEELMYKWAAYKKGGAVCTSMECATLFAAGAALGIRTAAVMASATNNETDSESILAPEIDIDDRSIRTAIEAMRMIIRKDKKEENYG